MESRKPEREYNAFAYELMIPTTPINALLYWERDFCFVFWGKRNDGRLWSDCARLTSLQKHRGPIIFIHQNTICTVYLYRVYKYKYRNIVYELTFPWSLTTIINVRSVKAWIQCITTLYALYFLRIFAPWMWSEDENGK